jgi:hypothetical protein
VEFLDNSNRPFTISQLKEHKYRSDGRDNLIKDDLSTFSTTMTTFLQNLYLIFASFEKVEMEDFAPVAKFPDSRIPILLKSTFNDPPSLQIDVSALQIRLENLKRLYDYGL